MCAQVMYMQCINSTGARTITLDNTETVRIEFMPGRDGRPGPRGPPGPAHGGVVYTRWGKSTCPTVPGTSMLYSGVAGGSNWGHEGGGGNLLCMPRDPQYILPSQPGVRGHAYIYGGHYWQPIQGHTSHDVPCAVCEVSTRVMHYMFPAKATCPPSWTLEYKGYIMTSFIGEDRSRGVFECVDEDQESLEGSIGPPGSPVSNHFALHHVEAGCANGIRCPPYNPNKELNCAVCTK